MTNDGFDAMNLVAEMRSRGVRFTDSGPEIPEHLTAVERLSVQRQIEGLTGMLTGPEAWPAVAALETGWLESLWGRLGEDDAGGFQDDITAERFDEIFQEWAEEEFGPVDTKGGFGKN